MKTRDIIAIGVLATVLLAVLNSLKPPKCKHCGPTAECELCED